MALVASANNPRKLISLRLPQDVIAFWKATGPGWQTRMAERLGQRKKVMRFKERCWLLAAVEQNCASNTQCVSLHLV